jgi:hypothetical protein
MYSYLIVTNTAQQGYSAISATTAVIDQLCEGESGQLYHVVFILNLLLPSE